MITANAYACFALIDLESRNRGKSIAKPRRFCGEYWLPIQINSDDAQRLIILAHTPNLTEQQLEELAFIKDRARSEMDLYTDETIKSRKHRLFYKWHKRHRNIAHIDIWPILQVVR